MGPLPSVTARSRGYSKITALLSRDQRKRSTDLPFLQTRQLVVLVFGLLLALFLLLITRNVSPEPYLYDEADYIRAASFGYSANWTDTPSISMAEFLRAGFSRGSAKALSERIRNSNDVLFYRHFHGPLFYYLLIPVSRLGLNERAVRMTMLMIPAATMAVIYFGALWLLPGPWAMFPALLFLTSHTVVWSTELAPHQLFALCSLGALILLVKAVATQRRSYWYACVVVAALAFCTLEVGLVLIVTVAMCGWTERRTFDADLRFVTKSLAIFLVTVLAVWPAAIFRLSFVKACAVVAYLALIRKAPWGDAGFIETWRGRIFDSPLEWALIVFALVVCFRNHAQGGAASLPGGVVCRSDVRGDASGSERLAALLADVYARAGSACWPHVVPLFGPLAEASQHCRPNAGFCGTLRDRLDSGRPQATQFQSPFGGG